MNPTYLAQPQTSVSHGLTIFVKVPRQREQFLQHLDEVGLNIGLLLFREGEEAVAYERELASAKEKVVIGTEIGRKEASRRIREHRATEERCAWALSRTRSRWQHDFRASV